jgi:hypothetical protein
MTRGVSVTKGASRSSDPKRRHAPRSDAAVTSSVEPEPGRGIDPQGSQRHRAQSRRGQFHRERQAFDEAAAQVAGARIVCRAAGGTPLRGGSRKTHGRSEPDIGGERQAIAIGRYEATWTAPPLLADPGSARNATGVTPVRRRTSSFM